MKLIVLKAAVYVQVAMALRSTQKNRSNDKDHKDNDGSSSVLLGSAGGNFKNVGTKTGKGKARNIATGRSSLNSNSSPNADHLIGNFCVFFINNFHLMNNYFELIIFLNTFC